MRRYRQVGGADSDEEFTQVLGDMTKHRSGGTSGGDLPPGAWDAGFDAISPTNVQLSFIKGTDVFDLVWTSPPGTTQTDDQKSKVSIALQGVATALIAHL